MKNIEILGINVVRGPNMWTYQTVLEAVIDIGELEDFPSNTLPGFTRRSVKPGSVLDGKSSNAW